MRHLWPINDQLDVLSQQKQQERRARYVPRGSAIEVQASTVNEMVVSGPAGTGKSRACLEKLNRIAEDHPGTRQLIVRKTRASLSESGLVTFERDVLGLDNPICSRLQRHLRQVYRYPNGSQIVVGGMDKAIRIMSTEYDGIYVQEATELTEDDWESLTTRLRNGKLDYQQLIADCNPSSPTHWLKKRSESRRTIMLESRHEDNPTLFNLDGSITERGQKYIEKLDALTGVRYLRLRKGLWASAEGMIYEGYNPTVHLIDAFEIPDDWRRFRVIDFGYTNPFVCQWWAVDPDGRMYRYREIYHTQRTVRLHALGDDDLGIRGIIELSSDEYLEATVADHDAEDRATLQELGIETIAAYKAVGRGIQAVQERMKLAGDGKPRIFLMRDSLVKVDGDLEECKRPTCTEQEIEGYKWAKGKEEPVKIDDHGMDTMRYAVAYVDQLGPQDVEPDIEYVDL